MASIQSTLTLECEALERLVQEHVLVGPALKVRSAKEQGGVALQDCRPWHRLAGAAVGLCNHTARVQNLVRKPSPSHRVQRIDVHIRP
jgi:hypothetical protein